jgi:hypothetical protein
MLVNLICIIFNTVCKSNFNFYIQKRKAVHVTRREGPHVCETWWLPHFLDNRLTGSSEAVTFTRRPPFIPQEDPWYSFLLEAESTPGP